MCVGLRDRDISRQMYTIVYNSYYYYTRYLVLITADNKRKARGERELATFDKNRRAVGMLSPTRDKK